MLTRYETANCRATEGADRHGWAGQCEGSRAVPAVAGVSDLAPHTACCAICGAALDFARESHVPYGLLRAHLTCALATCPID